MTNNPSTTPGRAPASPAPPPGSSNPDPVELRTLLRTEIPSIGSDLDTIESSRCGAGQLADSFRVTLSYEPARRGPAGVFVKLPPSNEQSASTARRIDAFAREQFFYEKLLPDLDIRTPRFLGTITFSDGRSGLVLEDLSEATRPLDQLRDGTIEQVASAMNQLAGLQAPLWDDVAATGGEMRFYNRLDGHTDGLADRYARSWQRYGDIVGGGLTQSQRRLIGRFGDTCRSWAASVTGPRTLTHQDLRLDNLLWSSTDGATVVDWQTLAFTSPAWDPAFLLGTALDPAQRRAVERETVAHHVDALAARGVVGWDIDRAWTEHRRLSGSVLLAMIAALAYVAPTSRGFEMFASLIARGVEQAHDLELIEFLD